MSGYLIFLVITIVKKKMSKKPRKYYPQETLKEQRNHYLLRWTFDRYTTKFFDRFARSSPIKMFIVFIAVLMLETYLIFGYLI
jgi:hypothetical protein